MNRLWLLSRRFYQAQPKFASDRPIAQVGVKWLEGVNFLATDQDGKVVTMSGAEGPGVSPMKMLLMALGGCASVDVVTIMRKQRQDLADLSVQVTGQRSKEGARPYETIHMKYVAKGSGLDKEKIEQAVKLSTEKYCGVHATLASVPSITFSVEVESD